MFDQMGEVSQGTHRNAFLFRVVRVSIGFCLVRYYQLSMSFGSQRAAFVKRLKVNYCFFINVLPGFHVIDRVDYEIQTVSELICEHMLCFLFHSNFINLGFETLVHLIHLCTSHFTFRFANVLLSEQKLTVKIGKLDDVVIGDTYLAIDSQAHQSKHFEHFTTYSSRTYQEGFNILQLILLLP